uniref:Cnidarian restricted protein n=1 Tax=Clytia hemisphaerica TaxID=252671 RepID=A0A7M5V5I3_9CNID
MDFNHRICSLLLIFTLIINLKLAENRPLTLEDQDEDLDITVDEDTHDEDKDEKKICKEKCDTTYGFQCAHAVETYENHFLCMSLKNSCRSKCTMEDKIRKLKRKVRRYKHKLESNSVKH